MTKRFSQQDLDDFSKFTGDYNTVHSSAVPADERRVHGALLNATVAGIIGTKLPGPGTVVLAQKFAFPKACRIDVDTKFCVRLLKDRKIGLVQFECSQDGDTVFRGEAKILTKKW